MKVQRVMSQRPLIIDPDDNVGIAGETMGWVHVPRSMHVRHSGRRQQLAEGASLDEPANRSRDQRHNRRHLDTKGAGLDR